MLDWKVFVEAPLRDLGSKAYQCRVQGAGFRVQGAGFRVQGAGCRVKGLGGPTIEYQSL